MNYLEPHMTAAGEFTRAFRARCVCTNWRDDAPCCLLRKGDPMQCFLLTPVGRSKRWLRRYVSAGGTACGGRGYHDAMVYLDTIDGEGVSGENQWPTTDPRWPVKCDHCDYAFTESDPHQLYARRLYKRSDTDDLTTIEEAPPGAMWDATWFNDWRAGADGKSIMVRCPDGHDWFVDGRASNCTMKDDDEHLVGSATVNRHRLPSTKTVRHAPPAVGRSRRRSGTAS